MTPRRAVKPYRWIAQHYDALFSDFRLPIDAARQRVLGRILARAESACDLACGTGSTAVKIAGRGIRTYGVDLSPLMCRLTRQRARRSRVPVRVINADMRTFRLPEAVDVITCEGDALNHVSRRADLCRVAKAVSRALRPGGYFFFDVNNALGFERYWTGNVWFEKPGFVMVMRNGHDRKARRAWSDLEWFVKEEGCWRRHHERVEEVCWDADEVLEALEDAGFGAVHHWDEARFFKGDSPVGPGCRTLFLARKRRTGSGSP